MPPTPAAFAAQPGKKGFPNASRNVSPREQRHHIFDPFEGTTLNVSWLTWYVEETYNASAQNNKGLSQCVLQYLPSGASPILFSEGPSCDSLYWSCVLLDESRLTFWLPLSIGFCQQVKCASLWGATTSQPHHLSVHWLPWHWLMCWFHLEECCMHSIWIFKVCKINILVLFLLWIKLRKGSKKKGKVRSFTIPRGICLT